MPQRLVDREPVVDRAALVASMVPPARFANVRFETYRPDAHQPSQGAAVEQLSAFVHPPRVRRFRAPHPHKPGVYLDGGFGVGKTHLLASLWHASEGPKLYGTFVELTHLVGAVGFGAAVDALADFRLVAIDEFELDDPGDTVLVSTLLRRLVDNGVRIAATSNTLPTELGAGRFATADFLREIQGLAAHFDAVQIDGDDYRHRGLPAPPAPLSEDELARRAEQEPASSYDGFESLLQHLARVHPSQYGALVAGVRLVCIERVAPVIDQAAALRLVVLADRLYDRDVPVLTSGVPLDQLFPAELLAGGYRKKYLRALSRLTALTRQAQTRGGVR
ncbi:MAG: cell division protein ZapE [Mycobacteriales bacterium]